jgi:vacuolar-type H+-ATPase subunit H
VAKDIIEKALRAESQAEQVIAEAQKGAALCLSTARIKAEALLEETEKVARAEAEEILAQAAAQAHKQAQEIMANAQREAQALYKNLTSRIPEAKKIWQ